MKKCGWVWFLLLGCAVAQADFGETDVLLHPNFPGSGPFIIEIIGTWPNDCHPGEQKPVVSHFDSGSARIEFEIVVVHVTCNYVPTPYRVLVDMSNLAGTFTNGSLQVQLEFGGSEGNWTVGLRCNPAVEYEKCPGGRPIRLSVRPDPGLYFTEGLDHQGLLLARQNQSLAVYPLVFDKSGRSQWLFSGGVVWGDTFFRNLYEYSNGQCPECPPPEGPIAELPAGRLTMLFDTPDTVQVKFNEQPFREYRPVTFGYGTVASEEGGEGLVNLSGKWAVSWHRPPHDLPTASPAPGEPLVFEIGLAEADGSASGTAAYTVVDLAGREMAQITCTVADSPPCVWHKAPGFWDSGFWDYGDGSDIPLAILSHRRIGYVFVGENDTVMAEAVRID